MRRVAATGPSSSGDDDELMGFLGRETGGVDQAIDRAMIFTDTSGEFLDVSASLELVTVASVSAPQRQRLSGRSVHQVRTFVTEVELRRAEQDEHDEESENEEPEDETTLTDEENDDDDDGDRPRCEDPATAPRATAISEQPVAASAGSLSRRLRSGRII